MDSSLKALLQALHSSSHYGDGRRLLATAVDLLACLSNPANVSLLTAHILTAPALWTEAIDIEYSQSVFLSFHNATLQVAKAYHGTKKPAFQYDTEVLCIRDWISAVLHCSKTNLPLWRYLLTIGGLLSAVVQGSIDIREPVIRRELSASLAQLVNLVLHGSDGSDLTIERKAVVLVLGNVAPLLYDTEVATFRHDRLLPLLTHAMYVSPLGLHKGYFVSRIDTDIVQTCGTKFMWSESSETHRELMKRSSSPILSNLGCLSRLASTCIMHIRETGVLMATMSDLLEFARSIHVQWTQNKLCEIDVTEERHFLDGVTLGRTMPLLWRMLQSCLFTVVVIQKALLERLLTSSNTTTNEVARLAVDTLSILHNLNFITTRGQYTVLSDYQYVYLSSVDLLASHPRQLDSFFKNLQVFHRGLLPVHPLERASDLFQLNLAEKSMLALSSTFCETSVLRLACDYLQAQAEPKLRDIREAAHSTVLALLVTQKTRAILEELLPFYLRLVLQEYPGHMNFSQFNLAIKTMIQASNASRSDLEGHSVYASMIMESIIDRAEHLLAHSPMLPPESRKTSPEINMERSTYLSTLVHCLPELSVGLNDEWQHFVHRILNLLEKHPEHCGAILGTLWNLLSTGRINPDCSLICMEWWTSRDIGRHVTPSIVLGLEG